MATQPAVWSDARKFFWQWEQIVTPGPIVVPVRVVFAPQCRLIHYLLGDARMDELLGIDRDQTPFDTVLEWCYQNLANSMPEYVSDERRLEIRGLLSDLKSELRRLFPDPDDRGLKKLCTREHGDWDAQGTSAWRICNNLKRRGFFLPFNHANQNMRSNLGDIFDPASTTYQFKNRFGGWKLSTFLTTPAKDIHDASINCIKELQNNGFFSHRVHNEFNPEDDPRISAATPFFPLLQIQDKDGRWHVKIGPNGKCCQNNQCITVAGCINCYCQSIDPENDPNGPCNSQSRPCP